MIQEQIAEELKPGKNAINHSCEMMATDPADEECVVRCLILANLQCQECAAWICGSEELNHAIVCVRCDTQFCPDCYHPHRIKNTCQQVITEADIA